MSNQYTSIIIGLLFAVSIVYFVEAVEELSEEEILEGTFFLITAIVHLGFIPFILLRSTKTPIILVIIGTISLIVLYFATRDDLEDIGELGMVSKIVQFAIVALGITFLVKYHN